MLSFLGRRCVLAGSFRIAALHSQKTIRPICTTFALRDSDKGRPPIHQDERLDAPTIPPYIENFNEEIDTKRSRLQYQSRKRGMLENGLLLGSFASEYLKGFNAEQLSLYDRLINLPSNDWEIFYWATGVKPTPEEFDNEIMNLLKQHTKNERRESRITMPNLK